MGGEVVSGPQLSGEGAELLASVLKKREEERHGTLSAQRNARRLESDALRMSPSEPANEGGTDEVVDVSAADDADQVDVGQRVDLDDGSEPKFGKLLLAMAVVCPLIFAVVLAVVLGGEPANVEAETADPLVETVGEAPEPIEPELTPETEVAGAVEVPDAQVDATAANTDDTANTANTANTDDTANTADEPQAVEADAAASTDAFTGGEVVSDRAVPGAFEIIVYDAEPAIGDVRSFALRVKNLGVDEEIPTDELDVVVGDEQVVTTISRFLHPTVPEGTSALASVRAEGVEPGNQFVRVLLDGIELARVPIE